MRLTASRIVAATLALGLMAASWTSIAQNHKLYTRATEGVVLPSPSITDVDDATALSVNPANLGFLDSWNLTYVGAWVDDQDRLAGQGHGLFFAFPLGPLGFGVATEFMLAPTGVREGWQGLDDRARLSLGMAINLQRAVGIGIAYRTLLRYDLGDVDTLDLSLSVRPVNHLALSFTVSDVNRPEVGYMTVDDPSLPARTELAPRRFAVGLTIRPLGNDRWSLGSELRYLSGLKNELGDETNRTDLTALMTAMIVDGFTLRARFGAEGLRDDEHEDGYYVDGSLAFDFGHFGLDVGSYYQVNPENGRGFEGASWAVSFSGDEAHAIQLPRALRPHRAVTIALEDSPDSFELAELLERLERLLADPSVDTLVLRPGSASLSMVESHELRRRIREFSAKEGRQTICYLADASASAYQACAAADHAWINPAGGIRLAGIRTQSVFFKDLLDEIGVVADIVRVGEYKSAPESLTRGSPSDPAALAMNRYLDSVYTRVVNHVQQDRSLGGLEAARKAIEGGPYTASEALAAGLVDRVVSADELEDEIGELVDGPLVMLDDYGDDPLRHRAYLDAPAVAVVHIDGDLIDGESVHIPLLDIRMTGAETVTEQLREIERDPRIRAVLLRIDSPGGSALASDLIWREVMSLRQSKPVIASLGEVAASGGYYIASAADVIYAEPTSLTGSIGVFYGKADLSGLLEKIGVGVTTYKRGAHADMQSWTRPYTPEERRKLLVQIREFYDLFLDRVVEGRGRGFTREIADKRGRGRIWSGSDAHHHLLVDHLGGYLEALDHAREKGHVSRGTRVFHVPDSKMGIVMRMVSSVRAAFAGDPSPAGILWSKAELGRLVRAALPLAFVDDRSPRARLPYAVLESPR